jgi:TrmH family RNA methyltransferase
VLSKARLKYLRSLRMKKVRAQEGLLLVEGLNAVAEAVNGGHALELLLTPDARERFPAVEAVEIGAPEAEALAQTRSPLGAFALVRDPCRLLNEATLPDTALVLFAAGVADPGNLGTLIRTAAAAGAAAVVASAGTVEPTNPKAARASAGALFRIPVLLGEASELKRLGFELWLADADGTPVRDAGPPPARCALVVGNEPRGTEPTVAGLADRRIAVPLRGGVESLNVAVAAGILLYELASNR